MSKSGMSDTGSASPDVDDKFDGLRDAVRGFVDQSAQKVDDLKAKVGEIKDQAFTRGGDALGRVSDMIKAHPLKAVGIAFGVGYVGMRLFRR